MKIVHVITGLGMGGAERVVCDLSDYLSSKGNEVLLIYLYGEANILPGKNVKVIKLDIFKLIPSLMKAIKLIKQYKPDLVHSHMFHANIFSRMLRLFCPGLKIINTAHSGNEGNKARMTLYRITNFLSDGFYSVSKQAVLDFENKGAVKRNCMKFVLNGVNTNRYVYSDTARDKIRQSLQLNDEVYMILSVGSLRDAKDVYTAIESAKLLKEQYNTNFKWFVVGDGPLYNELDKKLTRDELHEYFVFLGTKNNISEYYSAADLFVSSSKWEGFGLAIAEAMACKLPIVATSTGGATEIVRCDQDLVPVAAPSLLAETISNKIKSGLCSTRDQNNREHILKNFSLEASCEKWIEAYIEVVE